MKHLQLTQTNLMHVLDCLIEANYNSKHCSSVTVEMIWGCDQDVM